MNISIKTILRVSLMTMPLNYYAAARQRDKHWADDLSRAPNSPQEREKIQASLEQLRAALAQLIEDDQRKFKKS